MTPRARRWTRVAALAVGALVIWLQWELWTGRGGIPDVDRLKARVAAQKSENVALRARNQALEADVEDLKTGREAVEERAREELGMVRDDEIFYQVVETVPERSRGSHEDRR
jgi:cell division protein FtsB